MRVLSGAAMVILAVTTYSSASDVPDASECSVTVKASGVTMTCDSHMKLSSECCGAMNAAAGGGDPKAIQKKCSNSDDMDEMKNQGAMDIQDCKKSAQALAAPEM